MGRTPAGFPSEEGQRLLLDRDGHDSKYQVEVGRLQSEQLKLLRALAALNERFSVRGIEETSVLELYRTMLFKE